MGRALALLALCSLAGCQPPTDAGALGVGEAVAATPPTPRKDCEAIFERLVKIGTDAATAPDARVVPGHEPAASARQGYASVRPGWITSCATTIPRPTLACLRGARTLDGVAECRRAYAAATDAAAAILRVSEAARGLNEKGTLEQCEAAGDNLAAIAVAKSLGGLPEDTPADVREATERRERKAVEPHRQTFIDDCVDQYPTGILMCLVRARDTDAWAACVGR